MLKLEKDKKYLLACSGGPDSMALFNMLYEQNFDFAIAHVNYHKRAVSNDEEEMVKNYAQERNIAFYKIDAIKNDLKGNFQSWARRKRYEFFVKLAKEHNYHAILLAHHKDDLLETYIFQKTRGGLYDFFGLKEVSSYKDIMLIRPLLDYRKFELLNYCKKNSVPYSIDESNLQNVYSRNKIRHNLVEKLNDEEIQNYIQEINSLNEQIKQEEIIVQDYLKNEKLDIESFLTYQKSIQKRIIHELLKKHNLLASGKEIANIILFLSSKNHNKYTLKDIVIYKNYGYFELASICNSTYAITINKPMIIDNEFFFFDLIDGKNAFFIKEDSYPLKIMVPSKDEYVLIGKTSKKVNRLFIDEKISPKLRSIWPSIYDNKGKIIFFPRQNSLKYNEKLVFKMKVK